MFKKIYSNLILKFPIAIIMVVIIAIGFLGTYVSKLEIDASAETLLLENDQDLKFAREISKQYNTNDLLVITYKPNSDLLSDSSLEIIEKLSTDLKKLERVTSIVSILDVPLLQSPIKNIKELVNDISTLRDKEVDRVLVKNEFLTSPLYKNSLVSTDFSTTAILVNLKRDKKYFELLDSRNTLKEKSFNNKLSKDEKQKLLSLEKEFKAYRDILRVKEHQTIVNVREILKKYQNHASLFLGGVSMIADDIIGFVKSDLAVYGSTLIFILILILWIIFREPRWVVLPVIICLLSVVSTAGLLGMFGWEITVISSNFIALQLIITISIVLHLIVRYRELCLKYKNTSQRRLVLNTILSKANPSFFAIITTIAGFASLVLSNIEPVMNLGWMMSAGIAMSLIIAFIIFPTILVNLKKSKPYTKFENGLALTTICANIVEKKPKTILYFTIFTIIFTVYGSSLLIVENSFISYFKKSTEIYKGMEVIDQKLGGTTPLDVIFNFSTEKIVDSFEDEEDSFEEEFEQEEQSDQYWFTNDKMQKILKIHNYLESLSEVGNVQSLATMLKVGKILNNNEELDSFKLALLYNKLPDEYRDFILSPYINIEKNQVRFATRIIDSNKDLRRDELISKINTDINLMLEKGESFRVSNLMVLYNNMLQSLFDSQIKTLGAVTVILFIMFMLLFRSFTLAFIAIISNIVPIGVIFGLMGVLSIPLDIMTITIAAISIGIGVDDTIHYIHRFKEEFKKDHNYLQSMRRSHHSIGFAMTYTSLAVIIGFSILLLSNLIPTIYFGILTVIVMVTILASALLLLPKLIIVMKPFKTK